MKQSELSQAEWSEAADCVVFSGCEESVIRGFLETSGVKGLSLTGGEAIPQEVRAGHWGVVLTGSLRIYTGSAGETMLLNVVSAGQPFDIASLAGCGSGPVNSEIRAAGKCRVALIGAIDPAKLMKEYPEAAAGCMKYLCGRIGFLNRRIHTLSRSTAERKLADYLLGEFEAEGSRAVVRIRSCSELAVRVNLSRASLYRALGTLESAGVIVRSGRHIELTDIPALQRF